jgi:hypothetical protein
VSGASRSVYEAMRRALMQSKTATAAAVTKDLHFKMWLFIHSIHCLYRSSNWSYRHVYTHTLRKHLPHEYTQPYIYVSSFTIHYVYVCIYMCYCVCKTSLHALPCSVFVLLPKTTLHPCICWTALSCCDVDATLCMLLLTSR